MSDLVDLFAVLTATARGAVAVVRVVGSDLKTSLAARFSPKNVRAFKRFEAGSMLYGDWRNSRTTTEDVVICPLSAESAEIHCHGGAAAPEAIGRALVGLGFRQARPDELPAMMGVSPWALEISRALSRVETARGATTLLRQFEWADQVMARWKTWLSDGRDEALEQLRVELDRARHWESFGRHLLEPWTVVIYGEPNVGKSSLINALVGFERAIVHDTAGTTRDVVSQRTAVDGWMVEFKDTAGVRMAQDEIEGQGIALARVQVADADLAIRVIDATSIGDTPTVPGFDLFTGESVIDDSRSAPMTRSPDLVVLNKMDALGSNGQDQAGGESAKFQERQRERWDGLRRACIEHQIQLVETSAVTGDGISELLSAIVGQLVPDLPATDEIFAFNDASVAMLNAFIDV